MYACHFAILAATLATSSFGQNTPAPQIVGPVHPDAAAPSGRDFSQRAATRQPGYPVPDVQGPTVPQSVAPGGPDFTLTVYGANFIPASTVNWNRQPRATSYVSAHKLQAQILVSDIAVNTAGMITVTTTSPNGPITSSTYFQVEVHDPMPTMSATNEIIYSDFGFFTGGVADLNNDGFLDLVGVRGSSGFSAVASDLMNNGDGLFQPGWALTDKLYPYTAGGTFGDFNGDGNTDYLYLKGEARELQPAPLAVSLGNGDGTFTQGPSFGSFGSQFGPAPPDVAVGDFNQDGVLDVATIDAANGDRSLKMFLGNGDGTFTLAFTSYIGLLFNISAADFNGDGKLDLVGRVALSNSTFGIFILFGNGDGTFQPAKRIATIPVPIGDLTAPNYFVSDFNKDGSPDIAFSNFVGQVGILLNNGNGTFRPPVYYTVGSQIWFDFAVGDFNSDGNTDIIVQQSITSTEFSILLGNGDGTFRRKQKVNAGGYPAPLTVGDFNNDGLLDFTTGGFDDYVYLQQ